MAVEPGIPAICRPINVSACYYTNGLSTTAMTCPWTSLNQAASQCIALGTNYSGPNGTGAGAARDANNIYHCAYVTDQYTPNDRKANGPCDNGNCGFGNPINVGNANKFQIETDFTDPNGLLSFVRTYNSKTVPEHSNVGAGWHHNWAASVSNFYGPQALLRRPDSKEFIFRLIAGQWKPDVDVNVKLEAVTGGWKVTGSDNSVELYDATGKLTSLANAAGASVTLTYSDGTTNPSTGGVLEDTGAALVAGYLIRVTDFRGRSLEFRYNSALKIVKVIDPQGQAYQYAYGTNSNIASVTYPGGGTRTYHFNESAYTGGGNIPNGLTGITDENNIRYARFRYDSSWRAVGTEYVLPSGAVSS